MIQIDRIQQYLEHLTPLARGHLLTELERLEACGSEMPGSAAILARLRAEFPKDGSAQNRVANASIYFFEPLNPFLVDGAPDHANSGRLQRGSLYPIWEWICRDLLPTMARDYIKQMNHLIAIDDRREARQVSAAFQVKVIKLLDNALGTPEGSSGARTTIATYTASHAAYDDLVKMQHVFRARDALAKFSDALPSKIDRLEGARLSKVVAMLDEFGKTNADAIPFALALVSKRLRTPWQLIRLATKAAVSKDASEIARTPYAIAITMVLDLLDDHRASLRIALKKNRPFIAKDILTQIYDIEYALRVRIDSLQASDWGHRLDALMQSVANLVEAEVSRFPANVGHMLGSRSLKSYQSLGGRLTYMAWKGRDALHDIVAYGKKLLLQPEKSRA
jgi:hypothetical protein